jgi:tRNA modification GTPase
MLDEALLLWLPSPGSYTGEDTAELHIHGGRAVIEAVLAALGRLPGLRLAQPGEFSRRAFLSGRLDLTQAEGIADLIDAETDAQRRQALRQTGGELQRRYEEWRARLIGAQALIEATIDFSDEADVPEGLAADATRDAVQLRAELARHLDDGRRGEILREGFRVVIAGRPNVGKSSLMNALAKRDVAIVSEEAGTTRDVIEVRLDLDGLPVILSDTAGLRAAGGAIEREGIRRSLARAEAADLVLWVEDASAERLPIFLEIENLEAPRLVVANKCDLIGDRPPVLGPGAPIAVSALTGEGLDRLLGAIEAQARQRLGDLESAAMTRARHREGIDRALAALDTFLAGDLNEIELRAEDLRQAADALGRITGRVDVEDVLDRIFASFCIGK